jgi:ribosomal protein S18 acetylase RimI-like enzyme
MVKIREYIEQDWAAVCRVHDAARPDELAGSCDPRAFVPLAEDPEAEALRQFHIIVAEEEEQVIGFAAVDEDYLSFMYVHPQHYRRGIGRELLRASLQIATQNAWTIVLDGNEPAIALYRSEGFTEVARFESDNEGYPVTCVRMVRQPD